MTLASSLRNSARPALAVALCAFVSGFAPVGRAEESIPDATADAETREAKAAPADNSGNPYASIVIRNAFRLKAPLPPPAQPTNAAPVAETPKVDVKLAGLSQIRGVRYAYLMVPDTDRPGQFVYPTLTDDPKAGAVRHGTGLEVKQIDLKSKSVRLVNGGIEATINFEDNGIKNVASAPKPGGPPAPGGVMPNNAQRPGAVPAPGSASASPASAEPLVFSRNPNRASGGNAAATAQAAAANSFSAAADRAISNLNLPNRPLRTGTGGGVVSTPVTTPSTPINTPNTPSLPVEHQYEILIRQKQAAEAAGISLPPIPGVPFPSDPQ